MRKMSLNRKVHLGSMILILTALYLMYFFPNWVGSTIFFVAAIFVFFYLWLADVLHIGKLGKKIQKEIIEEDDAYRESLKPIPPWKRPPPRS